MPDHVLQLAAGGGWLRGGETWSPPAPFYAVVGDPIAHSLSPTLQNAALRDREIVNEYLPAHIPAGELARLIDRSWAPQLAGFNVTAPLKEEASALCDGRTDVARELGAVNTVKVENDHWLGHNTDSGGVAAVLAQAWIPATVPARAIVLGAGGSARAAVRALDEWGVKSVAVQNRSAAGRRRFGNWLDGDTWTPQIAEIEITELVPRARQSTPDEPTVWVVCLAGGVDALRYLPDTAGDTHCLLLDLRYGDQLPAGATKPLGFDFADGKPVLLMQGGLSFAWWFGPPLPWQAMLAAMPA